MGKKNVLEMDGGDGWEMMQMYFVPLKYTHKMVKMENVMYILPQFLKN